MTLSMENDFANHELSIEQLDTIAAAGWFSSAVHWVGHEASAIKHDVVAADNWVGGEVTKAGGNPVIASMAGTAVLIGLGVTLAA